MMVLSVLCFLYGACTHPINQQPNQTSLPSPGTYAAAVKITSLENALSALGDHVTNAYDSLHKHDRSYDDIPIDDLLSPFTLVEDNRETHYLRRFKDAKERAGYIDSVTTYDFVYFYEWDSYARSQGRYPVMPAGAYYLNTARTIVLNDSITENLFDLLFLYHEVVHVSQDISVRNAIGEKNGSLDYYYTFWAKQIPRSLPLMEMQAYTAQIFLLRILTHNQIIDVGRREQVTPQWLASTLAVPLPPSEVSQKTLLSLCEVINRYFFYRVDQDDEKGQQLFSSYMLQKHNAKQNTPFVFDFERMEYIPL